MQYVVVDPAATGHEYSDHHPFAFGEPEAVSLRSGSGHGPDPFSSDGHSDSAVQGGGGGEAELDAAEGGHMVAEQAGAAAGGGEGKEAEGGREGAPAFSDSHHLKISHRSKKISIISEISRYYRYYR